MKTFNSYKCYLGVFFVFAFLVSGSLFAQEARVIKIKGLNNMTYDKKEIVVKPGELITIRLYSDTEYKPRQMSHNWVLLKQTADVSAFVANAVKHATQDFLDPDQEDEVIAHTPMASGGQTVEVTFKAPERPSKYMYLCTFPGHFFAGMRGTLTVKP